MFCGLSMEENMAREDCGRILFVLVSVCLVSKNPNTPNWSHMADGPITWVVYEFRDLL